MWSKHNGHTPDTNMTFKNKITNKKQKNFSVGSIEQSDSVSTEIKANDGDKKKHPIQQQAKQAANRAKNKGRHRNKKDSTKVSTKDREKSTSCDTVEPKAKNIERNATDAIDEPDGVVLRNNHGVRASDVVVKRYSDSFVIENGVAETDPVAEGKSSTPTPLTRALSGFFVLDQTKKANRRFSDLFRPVGAKLSGSTESLKMSTKAEKNCVSDKTGKKEAKQSDQSAKGRGNQKNENAKKNSQTKPHEADKPLVGTDNTTNSYLKRVRSRICKSKSDDASKIELDSKYKKLKPKKSLDLNSRIPEEDVPSTPSPGEVKTGQAVTRKGSDRKPESSCEEVGRVAPEGDSQNSTDRQDDAQMPVEKSDAVIQSESSSQASGAKKKTSHINRSESVKEQPDKNRKQQQRRNVSDPSHNFNASSETEADRQQGLSKNVDSGSSSNSNLSCNGRLSESPSTSMDVHQATVRTQSDSDSDMDGEADPLNWQELVTEEELKKLNPNEKKRQEVINELFLTEASHVRMLKVLYKKFYKTLHSNQILKPDEMNLLFPNIKELLDIHLDINKEMRRIRKEDPLVRQIGDTLVATFTGNQGEALQKASATFCERQQLALEFIKKRRERDSKFDAILTDCEKSRQCRRLQLQAIIPAQMQRVTRYPLLLERLVKSVEAAEKGCSDYKDELIKLKQVHHQSKEILSHVNEAAKLAHNRHRLEEIQRHLEIPNFRASDQPTDNDFRNIDLTRYKLILEGGLYLRRPNKASVPVHILLLEEMVVILQKENDRFILKFFQSGNPGQPPLSPIIKMNTLLVRENAVCKNALFLVNTSTTSTVCMYDLQADDESKRETWRKHFSDAADAYNRREGKLNRGSTITTSSQDTASDSDANSIKEMSTENENLTNTEIISQPADTPELSTNTDYQNHSGEDNSEDQTPDMTPGGGIQLTSKVSAEDWPLIQPSQVNVVVPPVHTAESMLTPLEQIRRKDALVKQALAEKENLVADLLSIPREHFEHIADMAISASDVSTSSNSDITDRLLASVFQVNLLQKAVNEALNVTESEVVAAKGGKRPACSSQEPHYANDIRPVIPSIPASHVRDIVTSLSCQLTTLLSEVKSVEEDRDRLRKELHKMKEKLHEEHNLHNSVPFDDAASDGSAQEVFCEASSE